MQIRWILAVWAVALTSASGNELRDEHTERRFHLGGRLGAALTTCLFEEGWLTRRSATRALVVTGAGRTRLEALGVSRGAY